MASTDCCSLMQMGDAAWYDRPTLQQAVDEARQRTKSVLDPSVVDESSLDFVVPPPTAIAFSLIKGWLEAAAASDSKL